MPNYLTVAELRARKGLRIVIVQGMPSPWSQAAKTIFELKGLEYVMAPYVPFANNDEVVAWGGEDSAPLVAWNDEKPVHRWVDILNLAERIAPTPSLVPADAADRALMFGLSNEICGELGIGWNRRLQMLAPAIGSGQAPEGVVRMGGKYGYGDAGSKAAARRIAGSLNALAAQLAVQHERGSGFFVGDTLSALDLYWAAFANLVAPLPKEQCPMPEEWRPGFAAIDPETKAALAPSLIEHRDRIFAKYFRSPMEF